MIFQLFSFVVLRLNYFVFKGFGIKIFVKKIMNELNIMLFNKIMSEKKIYHSRRELSGFENGVLLTCKNKDIQHL